MKAWLLKLHRWVALTFALPLVFVLGTGVILSVEPWVVDRAIEPNGLTLAGIEKLLNQHDPADHARSLVYRSYDKTVTIGVGAGPTGTIVDTVTGEVQPRPSPLVSLFVTARQIHEKLFGLGWLVTASTMAMLALATLGALMGWPRFANSPSGWHKVIAWGLLPFVVLSPLTGLLMAFGVTFASPQAAPVAPGASMTAPAARGPSVTLREAVRIVGKDHDLSSLVWLRPRGGQFLVRLVEDGEYTVYAVTRDGTVAMPRNWPRLLHEGNFAAVWPALINFITSVAMAGLLVTGLWIWFGRRLRRRAPARNAAADKTALA
jgi:uncharacterized iron-regulated membrane protein